VARLETLTFSHHLAMPPALSAIWPDRPFERAAQMSRPTASSPTSSTKLAPGWLGAGPRPRRDQTLFDPLRGGRERVLNAGFFSLSSTSVAHPP